MSGAGVVTQSRRYLAGGILCAALHNAIVIGLTGAGIPMPAALAISFAVTVPTGYLFHSAVTFGQPCTRARHLRFIAGAVMGFGWSALLMILLRTGLGLPVAFATPLTTVILFAWNFAAARWAILGGRR